MLFNFYVKLSSCLICFQLFLLEANACSQATNKYASMHDPLPKEEFIPNGSLELVSRSPVKMKKSSKILRLLLVRHGETTANRANLLQGHINNYPLTQSGLNMAYSIGKALKSTEFLKVYTSDLLRAHKTALIITSENQHFKSQTGLERSMLLREVSFGIREALPRGTTIEEAKVIVANRDNIHVNDVEDYSETNEEIKKRQKVFLRQIVADMCEFGLEADTISKSVNVLCVTHSAFIRHLLANYSDLDKDCFIVANCSLTVIEIEYDETNPNSFTVHIDKSKISLTDHLSPVYSEETVVDGDRTTDITECYPFLKNVVYHN